MSAPERFIDAAEYDRVKRELDKLRDEHRKLYQATADVERKSYEEGREDARREYLRSRSASSPADFGDDIVHLTLPDNRGCIQFHVVGPLGARPLTGGILSPDADYSLRIWGPPSEGGGGYGVHEQGGGNLTDFSMSFDLTPEGIVIHRMDVTGLRTKYDRSSGSSPEGEPR